MTLLRLTKETQTDSRKLHSILYIYSAFYQVSTLMFFTGGGQDEAGQKAADMFFDAAPGSFIHGFIATLVVIIVSELGDKTFFIAAIMAMRHPRSNH